MGRCRAVWVESRHRLAALTELVPALGGKWTLSEPPRVPYEAHDQIDKPCCPEGQNDKRGVTSTFAAVGNVRCAIAGKVEQRHESQRSQNRSRQRDGQRNPIRKASPHGWSVS